MCAASQASRNFIASCPPGLEPLLEAELLELGIEGPFESGAGAVRFGSDWEGAARVLIRSRIASKLLLSLRKFSSKNAAMLYDQVRRVEWAQLLQPGQTIAVFSHGTNEGTDFALSFATLKIKDAVCDEIKKALGRERPNVDRQNPDARIEAFFLNGRCELSVDLSGEPLHRRGYREQGGAAPLRENRAAALLRFAGYDGSKPLLDPFCGSGTIVIEAALIATRTAPGTLRPLESFAMWKLLPETRPVLELERARAADERLPKAPEFIGGSDFSPKAVDLARANAKDAGVERTVNWRKADARTIEAPGYFLVSNPPYGVRMKERQEACALISEYTRQVKHVCPGSTLAFVVEKGDLEKAVGFKPSRKLSIKSGELELRFLKYEIFAGKRTAAKKNA